jgi:hypothetical protein
MATFEGNDFELNQHLKCQEILIGKIVWNWRQKFLQATFNFQAEAANWLILALFLRVTDHGSLSFTEKSAGT